MGPVGACTAVRRAVVIGNGVAGAENQCIGLVRALGLSHRLTIYRVIRPREGINKWLHWLPISLHKKVDYVIKRIHGNLRLPSIKSTRVISLPAEKKDNKGVSDILEADAKQIATMACETFEKDGPLLVVASGWDTISATSSIKRLAPEKVFAIQIQHPRSQLNRFDLVITPRHDYYPLTPQGQAQIPWFLRRWITPHEPPDRHVVLTLGALHQADSTALQLASRAWHAELAHLMEPLLVVNIGGPTSHCQYDVDLAKQLTASLQNVLWSCGSVRISFSRRTPDKVSNILVKEFRNHHKVHIWDCKGPNPHMGHLAWAAAFVITPDSVSMLSEACSTGKPVYVIGAERCTWKLADFHKSLQERGAVRPFTGEEDISESWSYPSLNDTAEAACHVVEALVEHGWTLQP
ncbi:mitochondrial fission protein ELM1-like isoform X3 [Rhododendron vialii]|uniref:mitochondrial fission protein ELM1-like isoform X3 n=1 Tax=Rhododendron vialii TaxID=182163 RepID=UPI00265EB49C|nr:mitochondrial fission protein ELM1-like isoform X3 [Rhododendron vialii]